MRPGRRIRWTRIGTFAAILVVGAGCIEGHPSGDPGAGAILAPGSVGRDPAAVSDITGFVLDEVSWGPIAGVRVVVGDLESRSAADGSYGLGGIRASVVLLEATKDGYERRSIVLPLSPGPNTFRIFMKRPGN